MKKITLMLVALCFGIFGFSVEANPIFSNSEAQISSQSSESIYYSGPAYASANNDLVMKAGQSVSVRWTSEGCSVNGENGYTPQPIRPAYPMLVNGRVKDMNYRVNYGGEWYYFNR